MWPRSAPCSIACCITGMCSSAVHGVGAPKRRPVVANDCCPDCTRQFPKKPCIGHDRRYNVDMFESQCLEPDWNQPRPPLSEVRSMCNRISVSRADLAAEVLGRFLERVRKSHNNGGAHLAAFTLGPDVVF